ncbi:MAG: hypothetical protein L0I76_35600 [Pseudonocardia sp.]|nr:hypothetical protein [Pseudonocardia sp.]
MSDELFYVGPVGGLRPLPDVAGSVDVPLARIGGTHQSLTGRLTHDTLGFQRHWTWAWDLLLAEHLPFVEALQLGLVPSPLRLVDPRRANRLPEQVASGGSLTRSSAGFATSFGGLTYRPLTSTGADPTTLPAAGLLQGAVEWQRPTSGAGSVYPSETVAEGTWRLPLIPGGETLELSMWVCGKAGMTVGIEWIEYDATGAGTGYFSAADGDTVELSTTVWQLITVNVEPAVGSVSLTPQLTVGAGEPAGSVYSTAWQVAALDAESLPSGMTAGACVDGDLSGGWRPGGGAPLVVTEPAGGGYPRFGFYSAGLTLIETR